MKNMKRLLGLLIVLGAASATAQVPSGPFSYVFTNKPLWDVSGSYTNDSSSNGVSDHAIMVITHTAKGQITGSRTDEITEGLNSADAIGTLTGKVSVRAGVPTATLNERGTLTGLHSGVSYTGTVVGKATATVDPLALTINSVASERLCAHGGRCVTDSGDETYDLPAGMTGDWTLDTAITNAATRLSGTGTLTLSNGRVLTYKITGSYIARTAVAKLKLIGQSDAVGTSLSLTTHGLAMDLTRLTGKVLGQKPTLP